MADKKISQLSAAATPLAGTEVLPIVQSSATVKVSAADITAGRAVSALTYASTVATGTAPLTVASTTEVANLRAANATSADTSNAVKSNATTGVMQIAGPAAAATRVMTIPDANFTAARTDAAQTFTGDQAFAAAIIKNAVNAGTSGTPSFDAVVKYNSGGGDRCELRGWNIAQSLGTRTWWSITATDDNGAQVDQITATFYSDIYAANHFRPSANNAYTLGNGTYRWSEVFAINGTINTSDANAKTQIEDLSDAELRVAKSLKGLIKKFKYKDAVAKKSDNARIHVGVIAQEVKAAFEAEGLDAHRYGMFCEDTWYEINGQAHSPGGPYYTENDPGAVKKTTFGIRYEQLLAFVVAAI
jgi:hypothetical protein